LAGSPVIEVVANLNAQGHRPRTGSQIDTSRFQLLMQDPYYAGIIAMSNWEVNPNGLHKPMITVEQFKELASIAKGVAYKPHKQFNPDFPLNKIMECTDCLADEDRIGHPKLVGFEHSN